MSRSIKKGFWVDPKLLKKMSKVRIGDKVVIKTWSRDSSITPEMVGYVFGVHNGKDHVTVSVVENMVGHHLGEFSPTRKFVRHGGKMQKDLEVKRAEAEKASVNAPQGGDTKK